MNTSWLRGGLAPTALFALLVSLAHARAADQKIGTDTDGDSYTIKLAGPGALLVDPAGGNGPINSITVVGGDATSALSVAVTKAAIGNPDGKVSIGQITASGGTGSIGSIVALKSDLIGVGITQDGVVEGDHGLVELVNVEAPLACRLQRVAWDVARADQR